MTDSRQIASILLIVLGIMVFILLILIGVWLFMKFKNKNNENREQKEKNPLADQKTKIEEKYNVQSVFDFMEFDKIVDNMIVQKKGKRYLMVVKCQGINYDLMSGVEKASVEQGFIQYLNTLRYPIQIYVQTKTVDLTSSLSTYKQKVKNIGTNLAQKEFDYNQKVRSGKYTKLALEKENFEIIKARNLYEYGMDIVDNTEKMSLNKNILTKQYYIIISYYPEEANDDNYVEDEIANIAFSELYTRAQSTTSLLSVCGINGKILDSFELAELLYSSYNRDEAEVYDLKRAINSGYDSMYVTAPDVLDKKMKELDKKIEMEAIERANEAIYKVRDEQEKEKQLAEKERKFKDLVKQVATSLVEQNRDVIGDETAKRAEEKIQNEGKKIKKSKKEALAKGKEETNEKKKVRRAGRPRKTA